MAERPLSVKEDRFARLYGSGRYSKVRAYQEAGYMPNGKKNSQRVESQKLAKKPKIRAAIQLYTLEQLPPLEDLREERAAALRNVRHLALTSEDDRVRLLATKSWFEFASILAQLPDRSEVERERDGGREALFKDLGALYRRALGENGAPALELEAVAEDAPANAPEVEQGVQSSDSPEMDAGDVEAISAGTEAQAMADDVGDAPPDPMPAPSGEWRVEAVPGANPPRKRRIWVPFIR
jgi:hypothetical protein